MAKKPTVTTITSGYASNTQLNANFVALRDGFDNTLSLDGSTPNSMGADLDMNGNDILNGGTMVVADLTVAGLDVTTALNSAVAATSASASAVDAQYNLINSTPFSAGGFTKVYDPETIGREICYGGCLRHVKASINSFFLKEEHGPYYKWRFSCSGQHGWFLNAPLEPSFKKLTKVKVL